MADALSMALTELLRKADTEPDLDTLREGVRVLTQALMELEVAQHLGAERVRHVGAQTIPFAERRGSEYFTSAVKDDDLYNCVQQTSTEKYRDRCPQAHEPLFQVPIRAFAFERRRQEVRRDEKKQSHKERRIDGEELIQNGCALLAAMPAGVGRGRASRHEFPGP